MSLTRKELLNEPIVNDPNEVDTNLTGEITVYPEGGGVYAYEDGIDARMAVADLCKDENHPPIHVSLK